jgi:hypothetical protein
VSHSVILQNFLSIHIDITRLFQELQFTMNSDAQSSRSSLATLSLSSWEQRISQYRLLSGQCPDGVIRAAWSVRVSGIGLPDTVGFESSPIRDAQCALAEFPVVDSGSGHVGPQSSLVEPIVYWISSQGRI